jgi:23S rRNA (cytosine1962-C5)-methyltransferase
MRLTLTRQYPSPLASPRSTPYPHAMTQHDTDTQATPRIALNAQAAKRRSARGAPWIFSNDLEMTPAARDLAPGSVVHITEPSSRILGTYHFNPHTLIAARLLTRSTNRAIDARFYADRLERALSLRERLFDVPYYRLVHAEGDQLPGLIVDRYGDILVVQANTAGMETDRALIISALKRVLKPQSILWAANSASREFEGLEAVDEVVHGDPSGPVSLIENGLTFQCDPVGGQKTGWFFDHRLNRLFVANLAKGATLLDLYSYAGAFGITAAKAGATSVLSIDRSESALALANQSATQNGVEANWRSETSEVFKWLETAKTRFDVVMADPPAFAKAKKDVPAATKGYEKLARMAAQRVNAGGFLCLASCSHHITMETFQNASAEGIRDGGRSAQLIHSAGAGPDHPVHPLLAQTAYLKFVVYRLD